MLSGPEILKQTKPSLWGKTKYLFTRNPIHLRPNIIIEPFDPKFCGSNSYDIHLGPALRFYHKDVELPPKDENATYEVVMTPEDGYLLWPGEFCLGTTVEYTETYNLVPQLSGRSSTARMGLAIHVTAGFGDDGFCGNWTLEIVNLSNNLVRLLPGMRLGQLYYLPIKGKSKEYAGRYKGQREATACRLYKDNQNGA